MLLRFLLKTFLVLLLLTLMFSIGYVNYAVGYATGVDDARMQFIDICEYTHALRNVQGETLYYCIRANNL